MVIRLCLSPSGDHTHSCLSGAYLAETCLLFFPFFKVIRCIKKQLWDKALKEYYAELHSGEKMAEKRRIDTR